MNTIRANRIPLTIAFIQWFVTTVFQVDRLFFSYDVQNMGTIRILYIIAIKILYLLFLIVAWCFGFDVYKKIKSGNENYKRGFFIFKLYFSIMMLLLLILWPGNWFWDDFWGLNTIESYGVNEWQHIITSIYQSVLLQILPFPGGVILLQNIIISLCVAFTVTQLELIFHLKNIKWKYIDGIVKILPFLLPPVLLYQFSGFRFGLYMYLEFVMLVILIGAARYKEEWNTKYLLLFCFLSVIAATWRTESFCYILFGCGFAFFVDKNIIPKKKKIVCILILLIGFMGVNKVQNIALGNSNYEVVSLICPGTELARKVDVNEDAELLADIDKVTKLDVIYENPMYDGTELYWNTDVIREGYTDEDYHDYLMAIIKLSLKYPKIVFAERWDMFMRANRPATGLVNGVAIFFDENNGNSAAIAARNKNWVAYKPLFKQFRKRFIYLSH